MIKNLLFNNCIQIINKELGGKSPIVVLDDANIDDAVDTAHSVIIYNKLKTKI